MESPRGLGDPSLGAFAQVLAEADLVVLLGKPLDFTLRFGARRHRGRGALRRASIPTAALLARAARAAARARIAGGAGRGRGPRPPR
jgi:acetolactate synthase I/II/III large subunit